MSAYKERLFQVLVGLQNSGEMSKQIDVFAFDTSKDLRDVGFDSVALVSLSAAVFSEFGIDIDEIFANSNSEETITLAKVLAAIEVGNTV